jgi:hypothetical protein
MHTMRDSTVTEGQEDVCPVCRRTILWLNTCHDLKAFAFEPEPLPTKYDDGHGWAPGLFRVRSTLRMCFAPMGMHPPAKRRRIANVMRLHTCRRVAA